MRKRKTSLPAPTGIVIDTDAVALQSIVDRRLALRLGVSLPLAATFAALAGLGPQTGRASR